MSGDLILARAAEIAVEKEATGGTAETLAAADVIGRVGDPTFSFDVETFESELHAADLSEYESSIGSLPASISGFTYMKGSGTAGTAPDWGLLLADSGQFSETINASTSVVYAPDSSPGNPCTVGLYRASISGSGGRAYIIKGARLSSLAITVRPGEPARLEYTWQGAFSSDPDTAPLGGTYDTTVAQVAKQMTFTLGSWTPLLKEWTCNIEFGLARVDNPGGASETSGICNYEVTSRKVTGTMQFSTIKAGTEDYIADLLAGTTKAFTCTIGATGGNIVTIEIPKLQYVGHGETSVEDLMADTLDWKAVRDSSGDDEITITLT